MGRFSSDTGGGGDFRQAPEGTHVARAYSIVDIGTHHGEYQGTPTVRNQVILRWELPFETEEFDGVQKPLIVSKFYTNSLSEKANLRRDLESWRSRAFSMDELMKFDLQTVLGKPCTLSVVHNEKGKAKVVSVAAVPKGTTCPPAFNPVSTFWIDEWSEKAFSELPEGFQRLIMDSDEYKAMRTPPGQRAAKDAGRKPGEDDEDIPYDDAPPF